MSDINGNYKRITLLVFKYILWNLDYKEEESIHRRYGKKNEVLIDHYTVIIKTANCKECC